MGKPQHLSNFPEMLDYLGRNLEGDDPIIVYPGNSGFWLKICMILEGDPVSVFNDYIGA